MAGNKRHKKGVYLSLKLCKSKGSCASFYAHDKTINQTLPLSGASDIINLDTDKMAKTMQCPQCGNYVEGKKTKSYANKVARQGAKSLVHSVTGVGGATLGAKTGAAIGSIIPGVGTGAGFLVGGAIGFIGSAMFNQKVNENIDKAGDFIEDEFADNEYEFTCPKCGHEWIGADETSQIDNDTSNLIERARRELNKQKRLLTIGTLGHVDHGKTTVSSAISAVLAKYSDIEFNQYYSFDEIDNAHEGDIGGTSVWSSCIEYETQNRHYLHIDCPNHMDYAKCLVSGAAQMDGAIVVVAATDGVMAQTREHILLARQVGIPRLVVFINKCDSPDVDNEMLELVEEDMRDLLSEYDYDYNTPIIKGSALGALYGEQDCEEAISELINIIDSWIPLPTLDRDKPFLMPIEDVFSITGQGTVVTGCIETGVVKVSDEVQIIGLGAEMRSVVIGVEMFRKILDEGEAGDNVGLLLSDIDYKTIKRGMVIYHPGEIQPSEYFIATIYVLKMEEGGRRTPFHNHYRPQFYIRTLDVTGEIMLPAGVEMVMPGDYVEVAVKLITPIAITEGLRFAIYEGERTVGLGQITNIIDAEDYEDWAYERDNYVYPEDEDEEYDDDTIDNLNEDEQEYIETLKDLLEDGDISDRERRMLDRMRQSLGISEQRAAELETSLQKPQLTEDEQEYLEMYREYADEGEITDKVRKRLDRFASALGISPERMKELESM